MSVKANGQMPKGSPALTIAGWLTAIYLLLVAIVLWWQGQTVATFRDMAPNELGDFLAGVFAPIAFLWLVAAVLIQRRELELTRIEFEMNRRVTEKQAAEAEKQAGALGAQTGLLLAARTDSLEKQRDELYDATVASLLGAIGGLRESYFQLRLEAGVDDLYGPPVERFLGHGQPSVGTLLSGLHNLIEHLAAGRVANVFPSVELQRTQQLLQAVVELLPELSPIAKVRASNVPYGVTLLQLENLVCELKKREEDPALRDSGPAHI